MCPSMASRWRSRQNWSEIRYWPKQIPVAIMAKREWWVLRQLGQGFFVWSLQTVASNVA